MNILLLIIANWNKWIMRFILIHKGYSEDLIKSFFNEVYEIYVKILLKLFLDKYTKILPSNYEEITNDNQNKKLFKKYYIKI